MTGACLAVAFLSDDPPEIAAVGVEGEFLSCRAIDEFEDRFRQAAVGKVAEILFRDLAMERCHFPPSSPVWS